MPDNHEAGRETPATRGTDEGESRLDEATRRVLRRRLTFDVARTSRATVISLGGELDVVCADTFRRRFTDVTDDGPEQVVLDLSELNFIDSTGLALLLRVNEMARDVGFTLWIVASKDAAPGKIFKMTGTNALLPLVDELPDL